MQVSSSDRNLTLSTKIQLRQIRRISPSVCVAELLPAAFGERGVSRESVTLAFFGGCAVMATSLVLEKAV